MQTIPLLAFVPSGIFMRPLFFESPKPILDKGSYMSEKWPTRGFNPLEKSQSDYYILYTVLKCLLLTNP